MTKPIIIMTMNWGKVGVTILKLLNERGKWGVTQVETSTDDAIMAPPAIRTKVRILDFMPILIMKEMMKSKIDVPPNSVPLSLEESGKNPD